MGQVGDSPERATGNPGANETASTTAIRPGQLAPGRIGLWAEKTRGAHGAGGGLDSDRALFKGRSRGRSKSSVRPFWSLPCASLDS
jgi:hypothetical protein